MERRSIATALVLAGSLALAAAPARAVAVEVATQQGATEVTVDLSGLAGDTARGPLAQTADPQPIRALALCGVGSAFAIAGHLLRDGGQRE